MYVAKGVAKGAPMWQKGHRCGKSGTNVAKVAPMWWARALWQEKINRKQGYTSITFLKPIAVF